MVLKQYQKEIDEEVKRKLIGESYRKGIKDQNLKVLGYPDIEEIQFARGQALQFAATIETEPEFELPDYRGLPAKREPALVTDDDVAKAIDSRFENSSWETRTFTESAFAANFAKQMGNIKFLLLLIGGLLTKRRR